MEGIILYIKLVITLFIQCTVQVKFKAYEKKEKRRSLAGKTEVLC